MSCHYSCLTCSTPNSFNSCLTCSSPSLLSNNSCFSPSTSFSIQPAQQFLDSVWQICSIFIIISYFLQARLPFSYRIISGMQRFSLLIHLNLLYLPMEQLYSLKSYYRTNGGYYLLFPNQSFSYLHAAPTALIAAMGILYWAVSYWVSLQPPSQQSYIAHLCSKALPAARNVYYFCSPQMYFFIGMEICSLSGSNLSSDVGSVVVLILEGGVCLMVLIMSLYNYRNDVIASAIFTPEWDLYCTVMPIPLVALAFLSSIPLIYSIYLTPLALMILIIFLKPEASKETHLVVLFGLECIMCALPVTLLQTGESYRSYILFVILALLLFGVFVEIISIQMGAIPLTGKKMEEQKKEEELKSRGTGSAAPAKMTPKVEQLS